MAAMGNRPYGGVEAGERQALRRDRFVAAGLDLLGRTDPDDLTVRAICAQAGLTARYFYESFADKDTFVAAVFDDVTATMAATTQAAVAAVAPADQNRAGISNIIGMIDTDPRIGRLLFSTQISNAALLRKRTEQSELFITLSGVHLQNALQVGGNSRIKATAAFVVGGVRQAITAWLNGEADLSRDELVDLLVTLLDGLSETRLFRSLTGAPQTVPQTSGRVDPE
jgi:AcrR family transcriptional regulator